MGNDTLLTTLLLDTIRYTCRWEIGSPQGFPTSLIEAAHTKLEVLLVLKQLESVKGKEERRNA
ncbi:hypothetical protein PIB30_102725, partial [Stylosanthes scabra]|nr:hypothetical protein [Stylosanthes scabra]